MPTISQVADFIATIAPPALAAEWDNVGLLVGDPTRSASRILTCLTITTESATEAVREDANLIVTHHPLPFHAFKQLTTRTPTGRLLLQLVEARIAIYSAHTAYDSAVAGINQKLAEGMKLTDIRPLVASEVVDGLGSGRCGSLAAPTSLDEVAQRLKQFLRISGLHRVGSAKRTVSKIAFACGSAGQYLAAARDVGCDVLVTGETTFHTCLEAEATGVALLLPGHFASERFGMELLADVLAAEFTDAVVWPSRDERDPLCWS